MYFLGYALPPTTDATPDCHDHRYAAAQPARIQPEKGPLGEISPPGRHSRLSQGRPSGYRRPRALLRAGPPTGGRARGDVKDWITMTQGTGTGPPTNTAGIPNGQFAGRLIEFSDLELDRKYPRGVYLNLHGYPDFSVYARHAVQIADPPAGLSVDEIRVTDVVAANLLGLRTGDPLLPAGPPAHGHAGGLDLGARGAHPAAVPGARRSSTPPSGTTAASPRCSWTGPRPACWHEGMLEPVAFERSGSVPEDGPGRCSSRSSASRCRSPTAASSAAPTAAARSAPRSTWPAASSSTTGCSGCAGTIRTRS